MIYLIKQQNSAVNSTLINSLDYRVCNVRDIVTDPKNIILRYNVPLHVKGRRTPLYTLHGLLPEWWRCVNDMYAVLVHAKLDISLFFSS